MKKSSTIEKLILDLLVEKMGNIIKIRQAREYHTSHTSLIEEICTYLKSKPEIKNYDFNTFLFNASYYGNLQAVKGILKFPHVDPNKLCDGRTALMIASNEDRRQVVREILSHPKTDPNIQSINGQTALHWASDWGHTEIVQELLRHPKIDPNIKDIDGDTAMSIADFRGRSDVVRLLLNHPKIIA